MTIFNSYVKLPEATPSFIEDYHSYYHHFPTAMAFFWNQNHHTFGPHHGPKAPPSASASLPNRQVSGNPRLSLLAKTIRGSTWYKDIAISTIYDF